MAEEEEEEEEEDDDDDESSDPDIEEEIQASIQQGGPDNDEVEDDSNEAEQASNNGSKEEQGAELSGADNDKCGVFPVSDSPSSRDSPSQSEPMQSKNKKNKKKRQLPKSSPEGKEEAVDSSNHVPVAVVSTSKLSQDTTDLSPDAADQFSSPPSPLVIPPNEDSFRERCDTQTTNGRSPPPSPRNTRSRKRKREEIQTSVQHTIIHDSEVDIPLDMGVLSCSPPPQAESTRADSPTQELVTSSQSTPPPKKNKVNVATQCDPDEIIVLSDSE